jgi:hypothetical protein
MKSSVILVPCRYEYLLTLSTQKKVNFLIIYCIISICMPFIKLKIPICVGDYFKLKSGNYGTISSNSSENAKTR